MTLEESAAYLAREGLGLTILKISPAAWFQRLLRLAHDEGLLAQLLEEADVQRRPPLSAAE